MQCQQLQKWCIFSIAASQNEKSNGKIFYGKSLKHFWWYLWLASFFVLLHFFSFATIFAPPTYPLTIIHLLPWIGDPFLFSDFDKSDFLSSSFLLLQFSNNVSKRPLKPWRWNVGWPEIYTSLLAFCVSNDLAISKI